MWIGHSAPWDRLENISPTHVMKMTYINLLWDFVSLVPGLLKETVSAFKETDCLGL